MTPQELLLTLIPAITILVQLLKPLVKAIPGQANNDGAVQLLAVVLSVAAVFGFAALQGILTPQDAPGLFAQAIVQGVGSVGLYHLMPGGASPASPSLAPAPAVAPAASVAPVAAPSVPPAPAPAEPAAAS